MSQPSAPKKRKNNPSQENLSNHNDQNVAPAMAAKNAGASSSKTTVGKQAPSVGGKRSVLTDLQQNHTMVGTPVLPDRIMPNGPGDRFPDPNLVRQKEKASQREHSARYDEFFRRRAAGPVSEADIDEILRIGRQAGETPDLNDVHAQVERLETMLQQSFAQLKAAHSQILEIKTELSALKCALQEHHSMGF